MYAIALRAIAILALAGPAAAHDFWLEPSPRRPRAGGDLAVHLRVGHAPAGEPVRRNGQRIERFTLWLDGREVPLPGRDGDDPAGRLTLPERLTGPAIVVYRSRPAYSDLPADRFDAYLREEGLEWVSKVRREANEQDRAGRERYSRCAKAVLCPLRADGDTGKVGGPAGVDAATSLPLELMAVGDICGLRAGDELQVELRWHGKPLAGALVDAATAGPAAGSTAEQGEPGAAAESPGAAAAGMAAAIQVRTDDRGRAKFPVRCGGVWIVSAVHMQRVEGDPRADWESFWASLVFDVPDK